MAGADVDQPSLAGIPGSVGALFLTRPGTVCVLLRTGADCRGSFEKC